MATILTATFACRRFHHAHGGDSHYCDDHDGDGDDGDHDGDDHDGDGDGESKL